MFTIYNYLTRNRLYISKKNHMQYIHLYERDKRAISHIFAQVPLFTCCYFRTTEWRSRKYYKCIWASISIITNTIKKIIWGNWMKNFSCFNIVSKWPCTPIFTFAYTYSITSHTSIRFQCLAHFIINIISVICMNNISISKHLTMCGFWPWNDIMNQESVRCWFLFLY